MTVVVTGATGFIGRHVLAALARRGIAARAVVRSTEDAARLAPGTSFAAVGSIESAEWGRALEGATAVVHLAARVHQMSEDGGAAAREQRYRVANVAPTERLADAAMRAGVRRFVFASTVKVFGEGRATPYRDDDEPAPVDPYGRSKLEAERALDERRGSGFEPVSLRPPLVHGDGVAGNFPRLLRLARLATRLPLPLGGIENLRSLIFVENMADAIVVAATSGGPVSGSFLVADQPPISTSALVERLASAAGRRARLFRMPAFASTALRSAGFEAEMDRLTSSLTVDDTRFRSTFNWNPPVPADEGLARTSRAWSGW